MTFYDVLGVTVEAGPDEIHERYRQLAKARHPDAGGADRAMAELNAAWDVLRDPAARRAYDRAQGLVSEPAPSNPPPIHPRTVRRLAENGFDIERIRWWRGGTSARPLALKAFEHADFAVLASLAGRRLFSLRMTHSSVSDSDVAHLGALDSLRILDLSNTHVTDRGIAQLLPLTGLEDLAMWGTDITDAAIPLIARLERLVSLNLGATRITDAAMEGLRPLSRLQLLNLRETGIGEKGLAALTRVPALRVLFTPHLAPKTRARVDALLTGVRLA